MSDFAKPAAKLGGNIPNTSQPTAGRGLVLDVNGLVPAAILGPTPTNSYVLVYDSSTGQSKWAQITSAGITDGTIVDADVNAAAAIGIAKLAGYPTDATKFLRGDATWAVPDVMPAGAVTAYGGASAPTGWLLCDGASVLRSTYANLFTAISTAYGSVDGTHFNVPDMRGRVGVGKGSNALVSTLANSDGVAEADRRPKHRHTAHTHTVDLGDNGAAGALFFQPKNSNITGLNQTSSSVDGGSGTAADSLDAPAYLVLNHIIKT